MNFYIVFLTANTDDPNDHILKMINDVYKLCSQMTH